MAGKGTGGRGTRHHGNNVGQSMKSDWKGFRRKVRMAIAKESEVLPEKKREASNPWNYD